MLEDGLPAQLEGVLREDLAGAGGPYEDRGANEKPSPKCPRRDEVADSVVFMNPAGGESLFENNTTERLGVREFRERPRRKSMSSSLTKRRIAALLLLAVPFLAHAQSASPAGRWEGSVELPGQKLEVFVSLAAGGGAWSGTIDIPAQGAKALPLTAIRDEGSSVTFAISGIPGDPTFSGVLSPDGGAILGG